MFSVSQANIPCETELRYLWGFGFEIDFCLSLANSREGKGGNIAQVKRVLRDICYGVYLMQL